VTSLRGTLWMSPPSILSLRVLIKSKYSTYIIPIARLYTTKFGSNFMSIFITMFFIGLFALAKFEFATGVF